MQTIRACLAVLAMACAEPTITAPAPATLALRGEGELRAVSGERPRQFERMTEVEAERGLALGHLLEQPRFGPILVRSCWR